MLAAGVGKEGHRAGALSRLDHRVGAQRQPQRPSVRPAERQALCLQHLAGTQGGADLFARPRVQPEPHALLVEQGGQVRADQGNRLADEKAVESDPVGKGAAPRRVHAEDRLAGGVEQETETLFLQAEIGKGVRAAPAEVVEGRGRPVHLVRVASGGPVEHKRRRLAAPQVDGLHVLGQLRQPAGDGPAEEQEQETGDQEGLHPVAAQEDDHPAQQPAMNPVQGGRHLQLADPLRAATGGVDQGKGVREGLALRWRALGPGDAAVHAHGGVDDVLAPGQPLELQVDLQVVEDPHAFFHGAHAGLRHRGEKTPDVAQFLAVIEKQLHTGGDHRQDGAEQDDLDGEAGGDAGG